MRTSGEAAAARWLDLPGPLAALVWSYKEGVIPGLVALCGKTPFFSEMGDSWSPCKSSVKLNRVLEDWHPLTPASPLHNQAWLVPAYREDGLVEVSWSSEGLTQTDRKPNGGQEGSNECMLSEQHMLMLSASSRACSVGGS